MARKSKYGAPKNHRKSTANSQKTAFLGFRIPETLKQDFRLLCVVRRTGMSTLLRNFIEQSVQGS